MTLEQLMNLIVNKLADESRRRRNSAIVWFLLGACFQTGIILLLYKAQSFANADVAEKLKFFFVVSPFAAWLPAAVAVYYFHRSRKSAMRPGNLLYRALTNEPRLIAEIEREPDSAPIETSPTKLNENPTDDCAGNIAGAIAESLLDIALSAAFGSVSDGNSDNDYSSSDTNSNYRIQPRVFARLTCGAKYEIHSPFDAEQTVAALQKHAAHAAVVEIKR